jgi:hypothetical protein
VTVSPEGATVRSVLPEHKGRTGTVTRREGEDAWVRWDDAAADAAAERIPVHHLYEPGSNPLAKEDP